MALDHALLVSLCEKPSSGYALARRFDRSIGYFWHATHQQIYKVLARMEEAGWVVAERLSGEAAPDSRQFSVTPAGLAELSRWLAEPHPPEATRDTLMVKLRGAAFDAPARLIPEFERHRAAHAERLAGYRAIAARDFSGPLAPRQALQHQVLKSGLCFEQAWLDWCDDTLALLRALAAAPPLPHRIAANENGDIHDNTDTPKEIRP